MHLPRPWANVIRSAFNKPLKFTVDADTRVAVQPFGEKEWLIHNYNTKESIVKLSTNKTGKVVNMLMGDVLAVENGTLTLTMPPRSKVWVK